MEMLVQLGTLDPYLTSQFSLGPQQTRGSELQGDSDANAATPPQSAAAFFDSAGSGGTAETPNLGASSG